uniref:Ras homolog family member F, filopodia associated n=1 Tax=Sus scrofa TaxID=9823 RepID=A0A8D0VF20_PIG
MDTPGAPAPTAAPGPGRKELKIVIVGDGGCGKTSLLMVYSQGSFPEHYAPSVFEKYTARVTVGSKEVTLNLYDTAGQEDYDRLRPLSYQNTHLVLICYDVMNPTSYDNVLIKWFPEVTHFCRGTPTVLIGCKTDLRKDKEQLRKLRAAQLEPITYMQVGQGPLLYPTPLPGAQVLGHSYGQKASQAFDLCIWGALMALGGLKPTGF